MNIQQLRYVVAIANNGTFREAASKLYVSQPSLSVSIKDLEEELNFKIFNRTTTGTVLTTQGLVFYEKALEVVKCFDSFEKQFSESEFDQNEFSVASQHYDFLAPIITEFAEKNSQNKRLRLFETTTIQILDEVAQGYSEIGIIYLNLQNRKGLYQRMEKLGLEYQELDSFQTHVYLGENHPLAKKESVKITELEGYPVVKFTQEKDEYLYYSENFVNTNETDITYYVTDRATLNGILERTEAFATGSGYIDQESVNAIKVIPVEDHLENKMVYVKRQDRNLTPSALTFITLLKEYLESYCQKEKA